jgi:hypothetical protein
MCAYDGYNIRTRILATLHAIIEKWRKKSSNAFMPSWVYACILIHIKFNIGAIPAIIAAKQNNNN